MLNNIKIIVKSKLKLITFLICSMIIKIHCEVNELQGKLLNSLLLNDGNLFLANANGLFIFNNNLENKIKQSTYMSKTVNSGNIYSLSSKTIIAQFPGTNGIIICLVEDTLYFFDPIEGFLFTSNLPTNQYSNSQLNVIPYEKKGEYYHFFVTFIINNNNLYIIHYRANNENLELIYQVTFKPFYFDFPKIIIGGKAIGCQIMNSENKGKVLTCCFQSNEEKFIIIQSFIIEKNFELIGEDIYAKIPSPNTEIIQTLASEDGKKLVSFYEENGVGYYFIFDIDSNHVIKNEPIIKECANTYNKFKSFFIDETKEYVFICANNNDKFTIVRMTNDFKIINKNSYSNPNFEIRNGLNSFSLIYDNTQCDKYSLIVDPLGLTGKHCITINFDENFDAGTPPQPFPELFPKNEIFTLPTDNKYYLHTKEYKFSVTVNDKKGKIIDFLDENNPSILTKEDKAINPSIYALNFEQLPEGVLKYIIDGEEIEVVSNKRIFGEFKLIYYPPERYGFQDRISYKVFLRNYSIASTQASHILNVCKQNCSCGIDIGSCLTCVDGYSHFRDGQNCYSDSDLTNSYKDSNGYYQSCYTKCKTCNGNYENENNMHCTSCYEEKDEYLIGNNCKLITCPNRFYKDKDTKIKICLNENSCPEDYPNYNEETKECKQNLPEIKTTEFITEIPTLKPITESPITTSIKQTQNLDEKTNIKSSIINDITNSVLPPTIISSNIKIESTAIKSQEMVETVVNSNSNSNINEYTNINTIFNKNTNLNTNEYTNTNINSSNINIHTDETDIKDIQYGTNNIDKDIHSTNSNTIIDTTKSEGEESTKKSEIYIPSEESNLERKELAQKLLDIIFGSKNGSIFFNEKELGEPNEAYSILSDFLTSGRVNISSGDEDIIVKQENYVFQITTTDNQKNSNYDSETSIIDLGECEKIIKRNISYEDDPTPLIILKIDIQKEDQKSTGVEYSVYNPYTKEKINLDICSSTKITVIAPVKLSSDETSLYDNLNEQGYDLFDANNSFYQDFCTPYTSQDGTDVILIDRKKNYYNENVTLCEDVCDYEKVNTENKKVFCKCSVKNEVDLANNNFNGEKFLENFYNVKDYTNYQVLTCYKLVFSSRVKKNICFYIFIILFVSFLTSMILNLIFTLKKIDEIIIKIFQLNFVKKFMKEIINIHKNKGNLQNHLRKSKLQNINSQKDDIMVSFEETSKKLKKYEKKLKNKRKSFFQSQNDQNIKGSKKNRKAKGENKQDKNLNEDIIINLKTDKKFNKRSTVVNESIIKNNLIDKKRHNTNPPLKKNKILYTDNANSNKINQIDDLTTEKNRLSKKKKNLGKKSRNKGKNKEKNKRQSTEQFSSLKILKNSLVSINSFTKKKHEDKYNKIGQKSSTLLGEHYKNNHIKNKIGKNTYEENQKKNIKFIDEELNEMNYKTAIIYDKRKYCEFYLSLLKKKHLIILTFISNNDYNVFFLKFSLFIISISGYFALNALFFTDSTMQRINVDRGKYNFLYQIPQILYSTIISSIMTFILKNLSLSQKELLKIKRESDKKKAKEIADKVKKCMKIKLHVFLFIGLSLLIFCWYYLTAFACVYPNTQLHLINDTLISFAVSMLYPFLINLVPGLFRLPALKAKKKNKECMYNTSKIIALF